MKSQAVGLALTLSLLVSCSVVAAQDSTTVTASTSKAAEGLDLRAVAELFKDSKDLEDFEKRLNDPNVGINNLDLNDDGDVDFIRVLAEAGGDTHVIVLQVPLAKDEFQDVATIEVEKAGSDQYNMQVTGNEHIYGPAYYVAPPSVHIIRWPVIATLYAPVYRPYRSAFYFGAYPRWWTPFHPVAVGVYHTRAVRLTARNTFVVTPTRRVTTVARVHYAPRSSTLVTNRTTVTRSATGTTTRSTTRATTHAGGKTTTKTKTTTTRRKH
ncbi:MAG: hypothetical protein AABO41_27375 [Acidobacteriota bacterium]